VRYSVPRDLVDAGVWAGFRGDELIVTSVTEAAWSSSPATSGP
jgi:hypothetical protein